MVGRRNGTGRFAPLATERFLPLAATDEEREAVRKMIERLSVFAESDPDVNDPPRKFRGRRVESDAVVTLDGNPLPPRFDLANHSPTGFEWGYAGSGPAQLALAMCAAVAPDWVALSVYQTFKLEFVATLDRDSEWETGERRVARSIAEILTAMLVVNNEARTLLNEELEAI